MDRRIESLIDKRCQIYRNKENHYRIRESARRNIFFILYVLVNKGRREDGKRYSLNITNLLNEVNIVFNKIIEGIIKKHNYSIREIKNSKYKWVLAKIKETDKWSLKNQIMGDTFVRGIIDISGLFINMIDNVQQHDKQQYLFRIISISPLGEQCYEELKKLYSDLYDYATTD